MALETRLETKLAQKLILTPQLQQAIKLLQLPQLELSQAINQEITENPFLEENQEEQYPVEGEEVTSNGSDNSGDIESPVEAFNSISVDEYFEERGSDGRDLGYFNSGFSEKPGYETFLASSTDLTEHLRWQIRLSNRSPEIVEAAEMIIGNIDENGYLRATDEELATVLNVGLDIIAKAIKFVQTFDPPGVGARNIEECLLLQIQRHGLGTPIIEKIITTYLPDLEKKRMQFIARELHATPEEVLEAVKIISELEPKPGRIYANPQISYIVPDVYVEKLQDEYRIILNDDHVPRVRISSFYRDILSNKGALDKNEKQFLIEKYRSALWLLKSLDERNKTIYRVTESILKLQREFFDKGLHKLKPLNLRVIAEDVSMHESNISRVTSNKFLSCSHGLFPFRYFFSSSLQADTGDVSSTTVKELIRKIVSEEDPLNPLTDNKIVDILNGRNITIARRTLAKYREELKIPSHVKRKRFDT